MRFFVLSVCLLGTISGCAMHKNVWQSQSEAPRQALIKRLPQPTKTTPVWSAVDCEGMEFIEGRGLVELSARRILGYSKSGEEIVIYDRDLEGPLSPMEQARRLRLFLQENKS